MDFVDGTLHRRHSGANIQRFAITWSQHLNEYRVNSWITSAIEPNVRIPNHISFPKLKCLVLDGVDFSDDDEYWNENFFSNCPVLEDFKIQRCTWFNIPNFCISAPALKNFKMDLWEDSGLRGCALKVDAPNLEFFYYDASIAKEYVLTTFPPLVRAAVQFCFNPYDATREQRIGHGAAVSQFLRALANVKRLSVSDETLQSVPSDDEEEEYDIAGSGIDVDAAKDDGSDSDASDGEDNHCSEDDDWTVDVVNDLECLFLHLKSVHFFDFTGNPMQMRWLKLILKNAKALQTMSISTYSESLTNLRV
ncbi:F-box/LRR-repeat protein At3g58900-like [Papaver somniferum]|uniref:F-box/LRR-repeat protein At3g58900-like n=1 Tax=Papaver somniferum TaxID=3469 RepID=UPI000E6F8FC3|nr:F-box/LRR-repeat protein At3g58900-like [Papaver somniferum]